MGKIPEYQRSRLVSSYVGGAQRDDSGAAIAGAVTQAAHSYLQIEIQKLKKAQDQFTDQAANKALMQYGLSVQTQARELQNTHADNPRDYPSAANAMMVTLAEEYSKSLAGDTKHKFLKGSNVMQKQITGASVQWAFAKEQENAQINMFDALETTAMAASESLTLDELETAIRSVSDTVWLSDSEFDGIPHSEKVKMELKYRERVLASHLANRIAHEPFAVARDLKQGVYDNYRVDLGDGKSVRLPMTLEAKKQFLDTAMQAERQSEYRKQYNDVLHFTGASQDVAEKVFISGEWGLGEVLKEITRAESAQDDEGYIRNLKSVRNVLLSKRTGAQSDPRVTQELDEKVMDLHSAISTVQKSLREGRGTKKAARTSVENLTDLLKLQNEVFSALDEGKLDRRKFNSYLQRIFPAIRLGIEAHESQGRGFFKGYRDPLGQYYTSLVQEVNRMDLPDHVKREVRSDAFTYFIEEVINAEKLSPDGALNKTQYQNAVKSAIAEVNRVRNPAFSHYMLGDMYNGRKIIGFRPDGRPILEGAGETTALILNGQN